MKRLLIFSLLYLTLWIPTTSCAECTDSGWFGTDCQYKCHCSDNNNCQNNVTCLNKCAAGWFGPACQYMDLMTDSSSSTIGVNQIKDNNEGTCFNGSTLDVTWPSPFPFTWLRIHVGNATVLQYITVQFSDGTDTTIINCTNFRSADISYTARDIHCDLDRTIKKIILTGEGVKSLCSVYVSGGRNVALKRNASQTTTFGQFPASKAVDGNRNGDFSSGESCTHTSANNNADPHPAWTLNFPKPHYVNRYVVYNREDCCLGRLKGFTLTNFDTNGVVLFSHIDAETSVLNVYTVVSVMGLKQPTSMQIQINATKQNNELILTLCEVEAYGDSVCESGKYGRECNQNCKCDQGKNCLVSTGGCPDGCVAGYYGESCQDECPSQYYGISCRNRCSNTCLNQECDRVTGKCKECIAGKTGDNCDKDCSPGWFGHNCKNMCSKQCKDNDPCDVNNGTCTNGCQPGYKNHNCNLTCDYKTYGQDCNFTCSMNCIVNDTLAPDVCNHENGVCHLGCKEGIDGIECGHHSSDDSDMTGLIAGLVVGIVLVLAVVGAVIFWRVRMHPKSKDQHVNKTFSEDLNFLHLEKVKSNTNDIEQPASEQNMKTNPGNKNKMKANKIKTAEAAATSPYYNIQTEASMTAIPVKNLLAFMATHDTDYFREQFEKVPSVNPDLNMEVGLSEDNKHKNRYKNICAYDHSRVHLIKNEAKHEGDYINASYIEGYTNEEKFIASQGPNRIMIDDFIRMLWEHKPDKVVMLTNLSEEGKAKCERYWPTDEPVTFGEITVELATTHIFADYTIRQLKLVKENEPGHSFTHFHFTSWPDKGVPTTPWALVDFEQRVASYTTYKPIIVHCSAGVGRTGTFIALRNVMREAEDRGTMDFYTTLLKLRKDRVYMVQTLEQYIFLHHAAQVAMVCLGTTVTATNITERIAFLNKVSSTGQTNMEKEYQDVCSVSAENESTEEETRMVYQNSGLTDSKTKNKVGNILPKEFYHPQLISDLNDTEDYINAVLVPSFTKQNNQILAQLPPLTNLVNFWHLITQYKVSLIVAFETAANYLPSKEGASINCETYTIQAETSKSNTFWEKQELVISKNGTKKTQPAIGSNHTEQHTVTHLKFLNTNLHVQNLAEVVGQIRSIRSLNDGRTVYMCRNGAHHSGLACILGLLLDRMDNDHCLTVPLVVGAIKAIQPQVIESQEQYRILYEVLKWYQEASSVYSNIEDIKSESSPFSKVPILPTNIANKKNNDDNIYANH